METIRRSEGTGRVVGMAALLVLAAFMLPLLFFGGAGGEWQMKEMAEAAGGTAEPQPSLLDPRAPAEKAGEEKESAAKESLDSACMVRVLNEQGAVEEMTMADYLWGVVAAEMPAAFEPEALKAQTVAARTYTLWKMEHNSVHPQADICKSHTCCQAWRDKAVAVEEWGEEGELYAGKISSAVEETDGMALFWEGQPIQAVYHSSSEGRTEDAVAVWGNAVPYLVGVETPEGEEVPNLHSVVMLTADEVKERLNGKGCDLSGSPKTWFGVAHCTANGNVRTMQVGGVSMGGTELRSLFGLRSANFTVEFEEELFTFRTAGYGHGVGMSQYGANGLAKQGKNWEEIVTWYYTGVTVEQYRNEA